MLRAEARHDYNMQLGTLCDGYWKLIIVATVRESVREAMALAIFQMNEFLILKTEKRFRGGFLWISKLLDFVCQFNQAESQVEERGCWLFRNTGETFFRDFKLTVVWG